MFNTGFNMNQNEISDATGLACDDESLAIQSAEEESNINTIVRRFGLTGELPNNLRMPQSGDFTGLPDFHAAMNMVRHAQEEFLRVPAEVRARFSNDPAKLMAFIDDSANYDEALKLGLVNKRPDPVPPSGTPEGGAAAG